MSVSSSSDNAESSNSGLAEGECSAYGSGAANPGKSSSITAKDAFDGLHSEDKEWGPSDRQRCQSSTVRLFQLRSSLHALMEPCLSKRPRDADSPTRRFSDVARAALHLPAERAPDAPRAVSARGASQRHERPRQGVPDGRGGRRHAGGLRHGARLLPARTPPQPVGRAAGRAARRIPRRGGVLGAGEWLRVGLPHGQLGVLRQSTVLFFS